MIEGQNDSWQALERFSAGVRDRPDPGNDPQNGGLGLGPHEITHFAQTEARRMFQPAILR